MDTNTLVSFDEIQGSLAGLSFPADKQSLIRRAKKRNASFELVQSLNGIPDRLYASENDVASVLGLDIEDENSP